MLGGWVEARRFSTTRLRPGYDQEEVDAFLTEIRDSFLGVRQPSLTSDEIRGKCFSTTRLRPGYDEEEVDAFLDEAELWLSAQVLPSGARPGKNNAGPGKTRDDWRVCIAFGDLQRQLKSDRQALIPALRSRLSGQVAVTSNGTEIFLYAPSAGLADEAAQAAREVLARHDVGAPVRTERWSRLGQEWRDVTDEPSADIAAELQAAHEYRQEQERERSRKAGFPAWQVRVNVRSHRDVVALAGILPPGDGGSAGAAGTCSSGRTAKTTLSAWSGSSPVTAALMRRLPPGSGGSAIATCCLTPSTPVVVDPFQVG